MANVKHDMVEVPYDDFKEYGKTMERGIIMFTEHTALIYYPENPNIRYKVEKPDECFQKSDFNFLGNGFQVIGQGPNDIKSNFQLFVDDIIGNKWKLFIFIVIYFLLANPYVIELKTLPSLNEMMIGVAGVYIGMLFVFIGFFYSDKERTIDVYKKGIGYKEYITDKYIIDLSIISLALFSVSFLICNIDISKLPGKIMQKPVMQLIQNNNIIYWSAFLLTLSAICLLVVEFDTLINYYLKDLRNKYFIDAFEDHIKGNK